MELEDVQIEESATENLGINTIKVIGIGGGGGKAVEHMQASGVRGVDFVVCNTDIEALHDSSVLKRIQLGPNILAGLGAAGNAEIAELAAKESEEKIKSLFDRKTRLVFIVAGMGGGTGSGAAPVIAEMARSMGIITMGMVTQPFIFEGIEARERSDLGIQKLKRFVDTLIVLNTNRLRDIYNDLSYESGYKAANEVLTTGIRCITEVITHHYTQDIDLRDVRTVLKDSGIAIMGHAIEAGEDRAIMAITKSLESPLLDGKRISGAKNVLLLIVSGADEITIDEIGEITDYIQKEAGHSANIIMGVGEDENLDDAIAVTIMATGFDQQDSKDEPIDKEGAQKKILVEDIDISEEGITRYDLSDYMEGVDDILEEEEQQFLEEETEYFFEKKTSGHYEDTKSLEKENISSRTKEHKAIKLLDTLVENELKNTFFKREVLLVGFMVVFVSIYLFALNSWNNLIAFVSIILSLVLVLLRLYNVYAVRSRKFQSIIRKILNSNLDQPNDLIKLSISELLRRRTKERKRILSHFNYKFKSSERNKEDIEVTREYKGQGSSLEENDSNNFD